VTYDLTAVVHVHSRHSDGTATVDEIAAAAASADAEAVLLTDHDSLAARRAGEEGRRGGVLVLAGHEVSPKAGHLLVFGADREIGHDGRTEPEICAAAQSAGALAFAAHPFSRGSRISTRIAPPHAWRALGAPGCDGIELWSLVTDSAEACRSVGELVRLVRAPERRVDGPPPEHLAAWDALGARRRVPAIGGLDAHQTGVRLAGRVLSPMPHARWFRLLQTNIQLDRPPRGDTRTDEAAILGALRDGRCLLVRRNLGDARGFRFWAQDGDAAVPMGGEARAGRWTLHVALPRPARLRLVHDGMPVVAVDGDRLRCDVDEPGVYRVEAAVDAYGGERTWIVSNPIYLRAAAATAAAPEASATPRPATAPARFRLRPGGAGGRFS
jgi:hypothetical protein